MKLLLWSAALFACGSLMFSYWLGLAASRNLRELGDGNPGALNLWRSAGYIYGIAGIVLDFAKGFVPVACLIAAGGLSGWGTACAAFMPIAGHAFSPFLRGRGGKAIATTFGVWCGLAFEGALAYAIILAILLLGTRALSQNQRTSAEADALQVVLGMLLLLCYAAWRGWPAPLQGLALGNLLLLAFTHRRELLRLGAGRAAQPGNRERE